MTKPDNTFGFGGGEFTKTLRKVCTCQKFKFSFLLLEYCKIRECYAVANAFTIRNMYSLFLYMKCNSRKINRTNCSACADYQPCCGFLWKFNVIKITAFQWRYGRIICMSYIGRMLSRLETCIVYSCIWSVTLAKSIVPRKTWRKLRHSYISKESMSVHFSSFPWILASPESGQRIVYFD
jgi:hypothetical protein